MTTRDLNDVSPKQSIPAGQHTTTQTGDTVDLRGYSSARCDWFFDVITDGSWLPSLQESDDDSTWTAVASADILGTLAAMTAVSPTVAQQASCRYKGTKRYIRQVATLTATASPTVGSAFAGTVTRGHPDVSIG